MVDIGASIRNARKKIGIPVKELADKMGVASSLIYNWEKNEKRMSADSLLKIARILGIEMELFPQIRDEMEKGLLDVQKKLQSAMDMAAESNNSAVTAVIEEMIEMVACLVGKLKLNGTPTEQKTTEHTEIIGVPKDFLDHFEVMRHKVAKIEEELREMKANN